MRDCISPSSLRALRRCSVRKSLTAVALLSLAACGSGGAAQNAQDTAKVLTGDVQGKSADNPVCALYSPADLQPYLGKTPSKGENAAVGTGCQWSATEDSDSEPSFVQIQVVPAAEGKGEGAVPSGAPGYREVPELGRTGYVVNDVGWEAGAFVGNEWIGVTISGPAASDSKAIALFKDVVARRR